MKLHSSTIFLSDLRVHALHGVFSEEHVTGNDYTISASVVYDISKAMLTDDVADTIDYSRLKDIIEQQMAIPSALVEHVAGRICDAVANAFPEVTEIRLQLTKLNPPMGAQCKGAGVEVVYKKQ